MDSSSPPSPLTNTHPIASNVVVAMGSTSTQGLRFNRKGEVSTLFQEDFPNPPGIKTSDTPANRIVLLAFLNYLYQFIGKGTFAIFVNSIGYSIDGGKKKGDEIGLSYSLVDHIENFKDTKFIGILSDIVNHPDNHHLKGKFVVVNRNCKTSDDEEISGQWTKRIAPYLLEQTRRSFDWVVDLGGKSATLYKTKQINVVGEVPHNIYVKEGTFFSDRAPNDLLATSNEAFNEALVEELQLMVSQKGIVLKNTAILQTGKARDQKIEGIFSSQVGFHSYLPQSTESEYEAIDFCKTVIKADSSSGVVLDARRTAFSGRITVHNIPPGSIWDLCTLM